MRIKTDIPTGKKVCYRFVVRFLHGFPGNHGDDEYNRAGSRTG